MKYKTLTLLAFTICFMQACDEPQTSSAVTSAESLKFTTTTNGVFIDDKGAAPVDSLQLTTTVNSKQSISLSQYNNTKGYWEDGQLITRFDCQDAVRDFPPVDIKQWYKVPVVNGRLPTYEETKNGTSLHHYGEKQNASVKPYNMILPKLAVYHNYETKTNDDAIVIVIQIVQTPTDTVVGFRYPTGGVGGNTFSHFHFLSDEEVKKVTQQ